MLLIHMLLIHMPRILWHRIDTHPRPNGHLPDPRPRPHRIGGRLV